MGGNVPDTCELAGDGGGHREGNAGHVEGLAREIGVEDDAVNTVPARPEVLEAEVEVDDEPDHQGGAKPNGEAENIDDGEYLGVPQVAQGGAPIVFEHGRCIWSVPGGAQFIRF